MEDTFDSGIPQRTFLCPRGVLRGIVDTAVTHQLGAMPKPPTSPETEHRRDSPRYREREEPGATSPVAMR